MRLNCEYDIVIEMDYPLGESSDLAYDTWGRDIRSKLADLNCRVVRTKNHLKISAPRVHAKTVGDLTWLIGLVLVRVVSQAPADISIRIHELTPTEREEVVIETIPIEEVI